MPKSNSRTAKKSIRRRRRIATRQRAASQNASRLAEECMRSPELEVTSEATERNAGEISQNEPSISFSPATQNTPVLLPRLISQAGNIFLCIPLFQRLSPRLFQRHPLGAQVKRI